MKELIILTTLLLLSYQSFAQQCSANDCPCFMKTGDRYIKKKNYKKAIFNYLVARDCDPKLGPTIEKKLNNVFSTIEKQKTALAKTLKEVEKEQAKNKQIINAFYFYDDKFALAYKNSKYGFINKKGEVVIEYKYTEALPFNRNTGLAKVNIKNVEKFDPEALELDDEDAEKSIQKEVKMLINIFGEEFLLAESLKELTPEIIMRIKS
ncbi:MAG: WG repeat-containing protein [Aureispira sp.]|nr:WG repeat-containing protein [Aureispira sp.]